MKTFYLTVYRFFLGCTMLLLGHTTLAQTHWEAIVTEGMLFKYLTPATTLNPSWITADFDDSNWRSAAGGFGYGDNDDRTSITATNSVYLRKKFTIPANVSIKQLSLDMDYDDAFVAYLNGVEIARSSNLPAGTPGVTANLTTDHEAKIYSGGTPDRFLVPTSHLVTGSNILAVQVINISNASSDMSARVFLTAEISGSNTFFSPMPEWYKLLVEYETSNLPIIHINTEGQNIVDEPKIMAKMQVINNANGINHFKDTVFEYDGDIGIEIRGNTAQMFPKKSYTIETRLSDGSNNNVELLGLPKENDWVLHGPYSDKSLMRNALAYHIGNGMGNWNPHNRFVEVTINNEYRGVYLLVEKIKIDKNRVDIATLKPEDIAGDQLTGGYIFSIDRQQEGSWNSPYIGRTGTYWTTFSYIDPKYDELNDTQRDYLRNYVTQFEDVLYGNNFKDPVSGYRAFIDVESFIDYLFITEISRDIDGYRVSVFFHKDKDSKDGKIKLSPFWDYNLCFGNANFYGGGTIEGWTADGIGRGDQGNEIPFWWERFSEDPYFQTTLKYRWNDLRAEVLSDNSVHHFIDSVHYLLRDAQMRNFEKFDILGNFVWPNVNVGQTYENEVGYLKNWMTERMKWLDAQFAQIVPSYPHTATDDILADLSVQVQPNPFTDRFEIRFNLQTPGDVRLVVTNILGKTVYTEAKSGLTGNQSFELDNQKLGNGNNVFIYTLWVNNVPVVNGKVIRK